MVMSMIMAMRASTSFGESVQGECPACHKLVYEELFILKDAYNIWAGKCPHCGAISFLDFYKGGYNSQRMYLILPDEEERIANDLPDGIPTVGWQNEVNKGKSKEEVIAWFEGGQQ